MASKEKGYNWQKRDINKRYCIFNILIFFYLAYTLFFKTSNLSQNLIEVLYAMPKFIYFLIIAFSH